MAQRAPSQIGFVLFSDSGFVLANPEQDLRGTNAYDADGRQVGSVKDLYIDGREREVRFIEVSTGGFFGMGGKRFLVPIEAVTKAAEGWVTIEPGRTDKVTGTPPIDTRVAPPDDNRDDDHASLPFSNAEGTVDYRGGIHSSFPFGRGPYQ